MKFIYQYPDVSGIETDMLDAGPVAAIAQTAEAGGWEGFAFTEHPAPGNRWLNTGGHQTLDPFIALGHAAAVTTRLRLLTYLAVGAYRNPLLLAKSAATVDKLSGGRFILGVGAGYQKSEFFALGAPFEERGALLDEALEVLPLHWSGEPFSFSGRHFEARDVIARPRPVQQPIPIWVGGNADAALRRVATRGQGWMPLVGGADLFRTTRAPGITTVEELGARIDELKQLCGERAESIDISMAYHDVAPDDPTQDSARHEDAMAQLAAIGVTHLVISAPTRSHAATTGFLDGFASTYFARV